MARKLLKISYLGTNYCGWQVQPNGITVQAVLQDALEEVLKHRPNLTGCSRTDSGVHAKEFFCHFDTDSSIPNKGITAALNAVLPFDISVYACYDVDDGFHARYNALGKTYQYKMYFSNISNPFSAGRLLRLRQDIDLDKAQEFCGLLLGEHNFEAFSSAHRSVTDTVRTVSECDLICDGNSYIFSVTANGFLYNMVRIMVGSMLDYSAGRINKQDVLLAFDNGDRSLLGTTAPPEGLYLEKVHYQKDFR